MNFKCFCDIVNICEPYFWNSSYNMLANAFPGGFCHFYRGEN